jgi:energy-converting hydrogenase B subunit D
MSVLWLILNTPDVALTEAAIGAGVTCILFIAVISRTERYER